MVATETVCANLTARALQAFVNVFAQVTILVAHFESSIACAFVADLIEHIK